MNDHILPQHDSLLTKEEVGQILKCTGAQVYEMTRTRSQLRQQHPIPFVRLPIGLRFSRNAIETWLQQLTEASKGRAA